MKKYQLLAALCLALMLALTLVTASHHWDNQVTAKSLLELVGHLVWSG